MCAPTESGRVTIPGPEPQILLGYALSIEQDRVIDGGVRHDAVRGRPPCLVACVQRVVDQGDWRPVGLIAPGVHKEDARRVAGPGDARSRIDGPGNLETRVEDVGVRSPLGPEAAL